MASSLMKELRSAHQSASSRTPALLQRFCLSPQLQWYELKRCEGSKRVYQLGETETNLVAVEGLLWTGSPISFSSVRGHATGGRYVLEGRMHDRIVKYANWNGQW
jgi:hypothetical protein